MENTPESTLRKAVIKSPIGMILPLITALSLSACYPAKSPKEIYQDVPHVSLSDEEGNVLVVGKLKEIKWETKENPMGNQIYEIIESSGGIDSPSNLTYKVLYHGEGDSLLPCYPNPSTEIGIEFIETGLTEISKEKITFKFFDTIADTFIVNCKPISDPEDFWR